MNQIDVFKYPRFPLSAETIDFLQGMAAMMAKAAGIGGDNFILSGCVAAGTNVSEGMVFINGELMPFIGGDVETYIIVEEVKRTVTAEGQVYEDIYITRQARFGTGSGQMVWADFERVLTIPELEYKIANVLPSGVIVMWSGAQPPEGWVICDGANGTPDLRGRFVVGENTEDLEFQYRGNTGGSKKVTLTVDQIPSHTHSYSAPILVGDHPGGSSGYNRPNGLSTGTTGSRGGGLSHENLPPYYTLAFIMKL